MRIFLNKCLDFFAQTAYDNDENDNRFQKRNEK